MYNRRLKYCFLAKIYNIIMNRVENPNNLIFILFKHTAINK